MAYNSNNRSERLLQNRRFTTDNLTLSQEAFTDVFDLGAGEIYTDDGLIPTGSSQLPYSGSSQNLLIVSASVVNPSIGTDLPILKYWYRKKLKPAGDGNREVYYFTTSDPAAVDDTVTSDQLIETDQQTNFVSPKYIIAANSVNNTESSTPGYKAVVYKDTASSAGSITNAAADPSTYTFDFKTGVLSWNDGSAPASNEYVYITVYQYVGRTLRSQIDDGSIGGGGGSTDISALNTFTGSIQTEVDTLTAATSSYLTSVPAGTVSGSSQVVDLLPSGVISGSSQITITESQISDLGHFTISDLPSGTVSSSAQITITESQISDLTHYTDSDVKTKLNTENVISSSAQIVSSLPGGLVSGSAQIISNLEGQSLSVATLTAETYIVSSSVTHMTTSFSSGSTIFGDDINDTHQFTGSMFVSGSISFSEIDGGTF